MAHGTPATASLARAGVHFALHEYRYDPQADRIGLQAAAALGVAPAIVLKTLMVRVDGRPACVMIPSDALLSFRRVAAAFGGKAAEMLAPAEAERITGYRVGGISPFGQRRAVPAAIAEQAMAESVLFLNGGRRGLQIALAPADVTRVLGCAVAPLTA